MNLNLYSVYDTAAAVYSRPFAATSDPAAIRTFCDIASDATHDIGKHPEDYTLMRLGTFDDNDGTIRPEDPTRLITGLEAYASARQNPTSTPPLPDDISDVNEKD